MNMAIDFQETEEQLAREMNRATEAEASVIELMLRDNGQFRSASLNSKWFASSVWRKVYGAIKALVDRGQIADHVSVADELGKSDPHVNWIEYVVDVHRNLIVRAESFDTYVQIIRDAYTKRMARAIAMQLANDAMNGQEAVDAAIRDLMDLDTDEQRHEHSMKTTMQETIEAIDRIHELAQSGGLVGITTGLIDLDHATGGWHDTDLVVIPARPAMGKAQPLTSKVLLASGEWKLMGDIELGDQLASVDGAPSKVTGVFPQGERPIYQIELSDGRMVEADAEHLWTIESSEFAGRKTVKTTGLIDMLERECYQNRIRLVGHTGDFGRLEDIGIDPWLLGSFLGGGCSPEGDVWMQQNGFAGKSGHEKYIPRQVFVARREIREGVLAGLIDPDGWVQDGVLQVLSASERMASDIAELVYSLGGSCRVRCKDVTGCGKPAYVCSIALDGIEGLIRSPRLRKNMRTRRESCNPIIRAVTFHRHDQAQCIMVDHPEHLYITDGYTVTHNTALLLNLALNAGTPFGIISSEQSHEQIGMRMVSIAGGVSGSKMRRGKLEDADWAKLTAGAQRIMGHQFWINDDPCITIDGIIRQARKWRYNNDIKILFVDYIQRIYPTDPKLPKHQQVEDVTKGLKSLAKELGIPVVALAQVNRECEKRNDKRPDDG